MHFETAQGQLSFLLKHSNFPRSILSNVPIFEESGVSDLFVGYDSLGGRMETANHKVLIINMEKTPSQVYRDYLYF